MRDAGFKPGTTASVVRRAANEPPHLIFLAVLAEFYENCAAAAFKIFYFHVQYVLNIKIKCSMTFLKFKTLARTIVN